MAEAPRERPLPSPGLRRFARTERSDQAGSKVSHFRWPLAPDLGEAGRQVITVLYIQLSPLRRRLVHGNHGAPEIVDVPSELAVLIFEPREAFPQPVCFTRDPLRRSANPPRNVFDAVSVTNAALSAALADPAHL